MHILVVEDEAVAAKQLMRLIQSSHQLAQMDWVETVGDCLRYLDSNTPELIFMDVHLGDGTCFDIFGQLPIDIPVIFTTAYDQYTLKAFKVNSVDYLLKPIDPQELNCSLDKFIRLQPLEPVVHQSDDFKTRFLVRCGRGFISVDAEDIAYIKSDNKINFLVNQAGRRYVIDYSLDRLQRMLDPKSFQRANRNFIISSKAVARIDSYFNYRLLLQLHPPNSEEIVVSRTYIKGFKQWLGK